MKRFTYTVPPTREVGSYKSTASTGSHETAAQAALWDYNSARTHDGLPPLSRMPAGTRYDFARLYYINRAGGGYRETVDEFATRKEARAMLAEYTTSDPAGSYYLSTRSCKGWND